MKVLYTGRKKNGTPIPDIIKMIHYNHPDVEFKPYNEDARGDVILSVNLPVKDPKERRQILYLGSVPSFRKSKFKNNLDFIDGSWFISDFCKRLLTSRWDFGKSEIILPFGPMPCDENLEPLEYSRKIKGPIQFVCVAKWYKRPYKRLKQILRLYHDFLRREYPDSILNIIGSPKESFKDGVFYYKKSFHNARNIEILKNSHINLIPTPFDTGPKTIPESMHYRVPFISSNNCASREYINIIGKCGIEIDTDPSIENLADYKKYDPLNYQSEYTKKKIPYKEYLEATKEIINNFEAYTSWDWNEKLNYKSQSDKIYEMLNGGQ